MRDFLKFSIWGLGILAVIGFVLYLTVFDVLVVAADDPNSTASIAPTLAAGDKILVFRNGAVKDGYLVTCADPDAPGRRVIGRVGGSGGESIVIASGSLTIDGKRVPSPRRCDQALQVMKHPVTGDEVKLNCSVEETAGTQHEYLAHVEIVDSSKSVVETDKIFLVSDNRFLHLDSRDFGQLNPSTCRHIVFRLWGESGYFDTSHRFTTLW